MGLQKFVPKAVLTSVKPKNLRKAIQSQFKKVAQLSEADCMLRFFELLRTQYNYHHEKFTCALGVSQLSNTVYNLLLRVTSDDNNSVANYV